MKQKIAIFLSGTGTNARNICSYFKNHPLITVKLLLSNKELSGAKGIGNEFKIPTIIFNKEEFFHSDKIVKILKQREIDVIVLAGFLWLIPENLLDSYPNSIINIHPALLPKYGGKGMYGKYVHEAVFANKERESGITIHLCNKEFDKGKILYQAKTNLSSINTPDSIAKAVQELEHQFYPKVIEDFILHKHD